MVANRIILHVEPGDIVKYSDNQFGRLDGAKLDHVKVHTFGVYAVLEYNGEKFTVPYHKVSK